MTTRIEGLSLEDELNLYLVQNGLKPASFVTVRPTEVPEISSPLEAAKFLWGSLMQRSMGISLKERYTDWITQNLEASGVQYQRIIPGNCSPNRPGFMISDTTKDIHFGIGSDTQSLEGLFQAANHYELGLSLGYPVQAIEQWCANSEQTGERYFAALNQMINAGLPYPNWLAYLSHIPEEFDLIQDKMPEASKKLGEQYQHFVRANNPQLAKRVEHHFHQETQTPWVIYDVDDQRMKPRYAHLGRDTST